MSCKLRDLIRAVRAAKTGAEERAIISRECALIRTAFKEGKDQYRARNVSKLIFIYLLGHPTEYGQMECVQMMTSESYVEKKIGYLALSLLLDEKSELIMLVENQMLMDLQKGSNNHKAMALCAIGNIAGEDMARDLGNEVAQVFDLNNNNLSKKACLAGLRIIRRVPTMCENFLEKLTNIFSTPGRSSMVLAGLTLINEALSMEEGKAYRTKYLHCLPKAIQTLKTLLLSPYASEHDIQGIANPFLQVKLLQFMRIIGSGEKVAAETMADVLAMVATNTGHHTSISNAIRYECVITIFAIDAEPSLRTIAVNILGSFLTSSSRDNNLRYVSLNTLRKIVSTDMRSVQQHKVVIVDCLSDVDTSIRRRAMDLIYSLVNAANVRILVPDLINYLTLANNEFKADLTGKICTAAERFAPTPQWHIDILLKVLSLAGSYVPENVCNTLIGLISQQPADMQLHSADKLWAEIAQPLSGSLTQKEALLTVGVWCTGEFADLLVTKHQTDLTFPETMVTTMNDIMQTTGTLGIKMYCLNALLKICVRFPQVKLLVLPTFEAYQASLDLELQQRAWEYLQMVECDELEDMAAFAADRMPEMQTSSVVREPGAVVAPPDNAAVEAAAAAAAEAAAAESAKAEQEKKKQDAGNAFLDDMFGGSTSVNPAAPAQQPAPAAAAVQAPAKQGLDLDDLFGGGGGGAPAPAAPAVSNSPAHVDPFAAPPAPTGPPPPAAPQEFTPPHPLLGKLDKAFEDEFIKISFYMSRPNPASQHDVMVHGVVYNKSAAPIHSVSLLAAVTRSAAVELEAMPSDRAPVGGYVVQPIKVNNNNNGSNGQAPIALKIQVTYTSEASGQAAQVAQFIASGLPNTA
eukprot:TRINITY_DN24551_c0_g1_i1.p1 TRINITY_DN24551_c0_g1~~TRINITY_DN24551_c0_g1_i1.p1  ORF type:complete len:861 (+),score=335.13 TRINITY_DN24551_c0_g1_i1:61-2643(+)